MKIISVGGSIIIPNTGFDTVFLKKFRELILEEVSHGMRFILMVGGGNTARAYQQAAKAIMPFSNEDLDWIGIQATLLNAHFVRFLFQDVSYPHVVSDPTKRVRSTSPIIVASGWKPGWSTDNCAVLFAESYGVKEIINLSNIAQVYEKDPKIYPDAKKIDSIDWTAFRRDIVGDTWEPGKSFPFDPVASRRAEALGLRVTILKGTNLPEVAKAIRGEPCEGTVVG